MTTLTISLSNELKEFAKKQAKKEGVSLTFIVQKLLQAYKEGDIDINSSFSEDKVTKSFDVSTPKGKKDCLNDFKSLIA